MATFGLHIRTKPIQHRIIFVESKDDIIKDILEGIDRSKDNYMIIEDRKEAIKEAITKAKKGDTILIAGKGHENYQIIKDEIIDFDDKIIAKEIMDNIEK